MVFPVVMYGCESWTIKKTEHCSKLMLLDSGVGEDSQESLGSSQCQRDGMEREERGGFRMGNTCIPVADSC